MLFLLRAKTAPLSLFPPTTLLSGALVVFWFYFTRCMRWSLLRVLLEQNVGMDGWMLEHWLMPWMDGLVWSDGLV